MQRVGDISRTNSIKTQHFLKTSKRTKRVTNLMRLLLCAAFLSLFPQLSMADSGNPGKPVWVGPSEIDSDDGYAQLNWAPGGNERVDLFQVREQAGGPPRHGFVTGSSELIYRVEPGDYEFSIKACQKDEVGDLNCGPWSDKLTVTVTTEIHGGDLPDQGTAAPKDSSDSGFSAATSPDVFGGPDQMQPGMWWNENKPGHGWSFYWANRLALPSMPSNAYDLYAIFYTYEAKTLYCMNAPLEPCNFNLGLSDYRPIALEAKLTLTGGKYQGALTVHQSNGTNPNVGWLEVTFTGNNKTANIDWNANFRFKSLADVETIELQFDDGHEVSAPSDLSARWEQSGSGFQPFVVENIGRDQVFPPYHDIEVVQVIYLDDGRDYAGTQLDILGRSAWIQAESLPSNLNEGETDLCFFHVNGYSPTQTNGNATIIGGGCNFGQPNSPTNQYGTRRFDVGDLETAQFWVDYTMPEEYNPITGGYAPSGSVSIGTPSNLKYIYKASNFHRVWYNGANSCHLTGSPPACQVNLSWFTDSDFPDATVFAFDGVNRTPLATSTSPIMENQLLNMTQPGSYVFELMMSSSPLSRRIAQSGTFTVTGTGGTSPVTPSVVQGQWDDCENHEYTVSWSHSNPGNVTHYELDETPPGSSTTTHNVSPGSNTSKAFDKSSGPFGNYTYRVRACNAAGCSADSSALNWEVNQVCTPPPEPESPWRTNAYIFGTPNTNLSWNYALGYRFMPLVDGQIVELAGFFNGTKRVKLFEGTTSTAPVLADVQITSSNDWQSVTLGQPVSVQANQTYIVAMYAAGSGASSVSVGGYPLTYGNISILKGAYTSTSSDPDRVPTSTSGTQMYGQVDIGFVPGGTPPGNEPPEFPSGVNPPGLANTAIVDFRTPIDDPDVGDTLNCIIGGGSLPSGLTLTTVGNNECVISGTAYDSVGNHNFTLQVDDGNGGVVSQPLNWSMSNTPPFFDAAKTMLVFEQGVNGAETLPVGDVDPVQSLVCSLATGSLPSGLTFSNDTNGNCVVSGLTNVSPATYNLTFSVSDGVTSKSSGTVVLEVTDAP